MDYRLKTIKYFIRQFDSRKYSVMEFFHSNEHPIVLQKLSTLVGIQNYSVVPITINYHGPGINPPPRRCIAGDSILISVRCTRGHLLKGYLSFFNMTTRGRMTHVRQCDMSSDTFLSNST